MQPDENTPEEPQTEPENTSPAEEPAEEQPETEPEPETVPRSYVEELRQENGKHRQRAHRADEYAQRLHTELVRATGRLADPTDLPFNEEHLDSPDLLAKAVDGVPPTFRTADRIGSASERNRGVGTKIREIQARVS